MDECIPTYLCLLPHGTDDIITCIWVYRESGHYVLFNMLFGFGAIEYVPDHAIAIWFWHDDVVLCMYTETMLSIRTWREMKYDEITTVSDDGCEEESTSRL